MRGMGLAVLVAASVMLPGCLAKTIVDVATLPVRAASKGIDLATTSQSEADQKRGREVRQREERVGKLQRQYENQLDECNEGDSRACSDARTTYAELQQILPTIPAEPEPR